MTSIETLHNRAMQAADLAGLERQRTNLHRALSLFQEAYELEQEAARMTNLEMEPTRSILFRSAASLALECGRYHDAAKLIQDARAGSPTPDIARELAEIESEIERHLGPASVKEAS